MADRGSGRWAWLRWASLLVPILTGLVASSLLLVDYTRPHPVFCHAGGGCEAVKHTAFASFFGIPTPAFGLAGFFLLGVLAVLGGRIARSALFFAAIPASLVAAFFLAVQGSIGVFCIFCVIVDVSALVVLAASLSRFRSEWDPPASGYARFGASSLVGCALVVPLTFGFMKKPPVAPLPAVIALEIANTPKGQVTVVDFADFECPWCRKTHAELAPLVAARHGRVRVARKHVPLTRLHAHAMDAARAACCGEALGKGEEMAEALFTTPTENLTPDGCEKLAVSLGLDEARFHSCVRDPKTEERIKTDSEAFRAADGHGLPTLWVGEEKLEGAQDKASLEQALDRALSR